MQAFTLLAVFVTLVVLVVNGEQEKVNKRMLQDFLNKRNAQAREDLLDDGLALESEFRKRVADSMENGEGEEDVAQIAREYRKRAEALMDSYPLPEEEEMQKRESKKHAKRSFSMMADMADKAAQKRWPSDAELQHGQNAYETVLSDVQKREIDNLLSEVRKRVVDIAHQHAGSLSKRELQYVNADTVMKRWPSAEESAMAKNAYMAASDVDKRDLEQLVGQINKRMVDFQTAAASGDKAVKKREQINVAEPKPAVAAKPKA